MQRVAHEIVHAFDQLLSDRQLPAELQAVQWVILTPKDTSQCLSLKTITVQETGHLKGHAWEQIDLYLAARNDTLLNFCNSGPIFHSRQFVMIHDACVYRRPVFYGAVYRLVHQTLGKLLAQHASIGTVSDFSRKELEDIFKLPPLSIGVFYNGVDHMQRAVPDLRIIDKLNLSNSNFFLCIGSLTKNKNVQVAIDALHQLGPTNARLVIVGGGNNRIFGEVQSGHSQNVIFTGRLSDQEIAALLTTATAFIFPSIYEGFGLPPLEAIYMGCPVLASKIQAVEEVCGDNITYFNVNDSTQLSKLMINILNKPSDFATNKAATYELLSKYTWKNTAMNLAQHIINKK